MTQVMLSTEERRIIERLREVPRGAARDELLGLVQDLVDFVRDPRCPDAQADGVPCTTVDTACEDCQCVASGLASLHRRLLTTLH